MGRSTSNSVRYTRLPRSPKTLTLSPPPRLPSSSVFVWPCPSSLLTLLYHCRSLSRSCSSTPLRACLARGPTTREILFYPLPRSNSLGFTGAVIRDTRVGRVHDRAHTSVQRRKRNRSLANAWTSLPESLFLVASVSVSIRPLLRLFFDFPPERYFPHAQITILLVRSTV